MPYLELKAFRTGRILFAGQYKTIKHALEAAIAQGVDLAGIELKDCNLEHANMDDAQFSNAVFFRCNMRRANLSEAKLDRARFLDCDLSEACLSYASLRQTNLIETPVTRVDMAGAWVENMIFSCPSALSLNFVDCKKFRNSVYIHNGHIHCLMTKQPVTIKGLKYDVTLMSDHIKVGCLVRRYDEMAKLKPELIMRLFGRDGLLFQTQFHPFIETATKLNAVDRYNGG